MIKTASQWIALGAVVGPIPFTLAWAMLGALRPGYSAISEPISLLGVGPHGLILDASFVITALLLIVGLVGAILNVGGMSVVSRSVSIVLLSLSPIGLAICGLFTADTPSVHYPAVALATGTPIVSFAVVGLLMLRVPGWRRFGAWLIQSADPGAHLARHHRSDRHAGWSHRRRRRPDRADSRRGNLRLVRRPGLARLPRCTQHEWEPSVRFYPLGDLDPIIDNGSAPKGPGF